MTALRAGLGAGAGLCALAGLVAQLAAAPDPATMAESSGAPSPATSTQPPPPAIRDDAGTVRDVAVRDAAVRDAAPAVRAVSPTRVASYTLEARLDAPTHTVLGRGAIHWVNTSTRAVDELYFHFYLEAFSGPDTLFNRSPFTRARGGRWPQRWGGLTLKRLVARELGGADLLAALEPHSPNDPRDRTDRRLPLPRAIAPGEALTLEVEFESALPSLVERTGFSRDFHFVAQWFPKLARLEPDGTWAHFPFHPHAEFYADYGDYDVSIDVPEAMIVGATGRRTSEVVAEGRRIVRQRAERVHDFAWTAWPSFEQLEASVGATQVHLLYPPGHSTNAARTLETLRFALPHFEGRYGPYPYPDLTVVHPPTHAAAAGGMEYPTLITTGGAWHTPHWSRSVELVTLHELGHQWFYGLLASHEPRWPVLDEGLTSYAESVAAEEMLGPSSASHLLGLELSADALRRAAIRLEAPDVPLAQPASDFVNFRELGAIVYSRTALLFRTLAGVYGQAKLTEALRSYAHRYRFRHPTPEDLVDVLERHLGGGAAENVRGALFHGHSVNYVASELSSVRTHPPGASAGQIESRLVVRRYGDLVFPVDVLLVAANGQRFTERWPGESRVRVISHLGDSPIVRAVVDPAHTVWIDDNLLDNAISAAPERAPLSLARAMYFVQLALDWLAP